jgi:hypothetical protein
MRKNILFLTVMFHLLSALAIGGYVHALHDSQDGYACPIPLAMGTACANDHFFSGADYLVGLLAIPLGGGVLFFLFVFLRGRQKERHDIGPPISARTIIRLFHILKGSARRRLCRWLILHRGDYYVPVWNGRAFILYVI